MHHFRKTKWCVILSAWEPRLICLVLQYVICIMLQNNNNSNTNSTTTTTTTNNCNIKNNNKNNSNSSLYTCQLNRSLPCYEHTLLHLMGLQLSHVHKGLRLPLRADHPTPGVLSHVSLQQFQNSSSALPRSPGSTNWFHVFVRRCGIGEPGRLIPSASSVFPQRAIESVCRMFKGGCWADPCDGCVCVCLGGGCCLHSCQDYSTATYPS